MVALVLAWVTPADARPLRVLVPDADNLQYMTFWVAKAAGFFAAEGVEITVVAPERPAEAASLAKGGTCEAYVMPPPLLLDLVADGFPLVAVANLLRNDPVNLVVKNQTLMDHHVDTNVPVADRLRALRGIRIGVAPGPPPRLRALYAAVGLDVAKDVNVVIVPGPRQNDALATGEVDALFAHTPYLERALLEQGAQVVVNLSGAEVPKVASKQIHTLAVGRPFLEREPELVGHLVRAVARAQLLLRKHPEAARAALAKEFPKMKAENLALVVALYGPAIPESASVSTEGLEDALRVFPASKQAPALDAGTLATAVEARFARAVDEELRVDPTKADLSSPSTELPDETGMEAGHGRHEGKGHGRHRGRWVWAVGFLVGVTAGSLAYRAWAKRKRPPSPPS